MGQQTGVYRMGQQTGVYTMGQQTGVYTMGQQTGVYRMSVGKPERKRPLGIPRLRLENNVKVDLKAAG
jgi:hypothetical protein